MRDLSIQYCSLNQSFIPIRQCVRHNNVVIQQLSVQQTTQGNSCSSIVYSVIEKQAHGQMYSRFTAGLSIEANHCETFNTLTDSAHSRYFCFILFHSANYTTHNSHNPLLIICQVYISSNTSVYNTYSTPNDEFL